MVRSTPDMTTIYEQISAALAGNQQFALGVISGIKGSSPQKKGAKALFFGDGRIIGTLGGGWKHGLTHWAFCLGDQPHLRNETFEALLKFSAENPESLVQPSICNRPRHPVVMPKSVFKRLGDAREAGLRVFLKSHQHLARSIECNDPGLDLDIDTPAEYEQALKLVCSDAQRIR